MNSLLLVQLMAIVVGVSAVPNESLPSLDSLGPRAVEIFKEITSHLCVDCFGRNLTAMLNCLGSDELKERMALFRSDCPAAPKHFKKYLRKRF